MALYHFCVKTFSRGTRSTVRAMAYRAGCKLYDAQTGESFNYRTKEVQNVELVLPKDAPSWAVEIQSLMKTNREKGVQAFCEKAEGAEKRIDARVWREFEFSLHRELSEEQNIELAREFVQDQICGHGMAAQMNFHFDVDEETGEPKPHCHVVATTRRLEEGGFSLKKERDWNSKEFLCELREQWQEYSNFHLKLHGHDVQIDHRSYKDQGIDMEPQPKQGKGVLEQEQRTAQPSFITDKAQSFYDVQLRNLYRIMRNPEVVFNIVTKHHTTFMWGDVQKVLHRYVDDPHLFQKLDARLKSSRELLVLQEGVDEDKSQASLAIFTTRSMVQSEKNLVSLAENLDKSKTHGVADKHIKGALKFANKSLKSFGGLSQDQVQAIHHVCGEGQLKCLVGIAGAGKTTALGVCKEVWEAGGYKVYGLAPTGKAAQNLEGSGLDEKGISSMTLHKFLKSFEEGRCHYNASSVFVLDEAGMVDVERFEKLLGAVNQLGVKLVVVGDGAQLQPVEAGPAFRLVTTRLGKAELNTVIRQKEDWQCKATKLFGQQKTAEALELYKSKGNIHIVEEDRSSARESLIQAWHSDYRGIQDNKERSFLNRLFKDKSTEGDRKQSTLILAHTNRDVSDLNRKARSVLKGSGDLDKKDHTFMIKKEKEDDFGKRITHEEEKAFAKGDQIVFTRNNQGLGVKNGTMGIISEIDKQKIKVKLRGKDNEKEIAFSPNLTPYFDQGWAVTVHKSQGTTVDKAYVLATPQMNQNLTYVAMTRHREDVHVYGSAQDFWSSENLIRDLSKSGEKLSAADYLDAKSLLALMEKDGHLITKLFERLSNELEAMGAVSKKAFWKVADHFLGRGKENQIGLGRLDEYESKTSKPFWKLNEKEEERAHEVLKTKTGPELEL